MVDQTAGYGVEDVVDRYAEKGEAGVGHKEGDAVLSGSTGV